MVKHTRDTLVKAQLMGKAHFKAGGKCVPLLNKELMDLAEATGDNTIGCSIPLFKAFNRGFALASLASDRAALR